MDTTIWIVLIASGLLFTTFLIGIAFISKSVTSKQQKRPREYLESPRKYPDKGERGERYIASLLEQHCMTEHDRVINGAIMYDPRRAMSSEIDRIYQTLYDHIKRYPITKEQHVAAVRTLHTDDQ